MSFIKLFKRIHKCNMQRGQAAIEYAILFIVATLGVMSFLWFTWSSGAGQAETKGKARNMAQAYFDSASAEILGN